MRICRLSRLCHPRFIFEARRSGTKPVSLQTVILRNFKGSSEIVFRRRLVASTKCWSDFQLLNVGIGTGVIVGFSPLSDKFELTNTPKLIL